MPEEKQPKLTDMRSITATAVRVAMARIGLDHTRLAKRMAALGQPWHRQTTGLVVRGTRRVSVDELLPLSIALECSMSELISTSDPAHRNTVVAVSGAGTIPAADVQLSAGFGAPTPLVYWENDRPRFADRSIVNGLARTVSRDQQVARRAIREEARLQPVPMDRSALVANLVDQLHPFRDTLLEQLSRTGDTRFAGKTAGDLGLSDADLVRLAEEVLSGEEERGDG